MFKAVLELVKAHGDDEKKTNGGIGMKIIVQMGNDGYWYWWLVARNGQDLARSHNNFKRKTHCVESARAVIRNIVDGNVTVEVDER